VNYRVGFARAFSVASVCWYIGAAVILYPKWDQSNRARQEANHILLGTPEKDGARSFFIDEIAPTPTSLDDLVKGWKPSKPDSHGSFTGASLSDSRTELKKKLSPMRLDAWQAADNKASELRPIKETAIFLFVPAGVYALFIAGMWIIQGFRSSPITG
jgi:hypothetical protein